MRKLISEQGTIEKQYAIFAGKWRRYHGLGTFRHLGDIKTIVKNIRDIFLLFIGFWQSFFILLSWRPAVVFVKGGYVGLPVGLAAALLRVPIVTHDSDSIPGLTNRILSRFTKLMAVGLPVEFYEHYYPKSKTRFTGTPIRPEFLNMNSQTKITAREQLDVKENDKVVAIIGGSLGAIRLNEAVLDNLSKFLSDPSLHLLWVVGNRQYNELQKRVENLGADRYRLHIYPFTLELDRLVAAADVVVSRAGATSIAELAAAKKPTILVPNPYLAGGHQLVNAESLTSAEAALVITEDQLLANPLVLSEEIFMLLDDQSLKNKLAYNIHSLTISNAATRIVTVIHEAVNK